MKPKHLFLAIAAVLATGGLWLASGTWRGHASHKSATAPGLQAPPGQPQPGQMLRPPDPIRKFWELTPEQRVMHARQPQGG